MGEGSGKGRGESEIGSDSGQAGSGRGTVERTSRACEGEGDAVEDDRGFWLGGGWKGEDRVIVE